jgi:hypothetical protein
VGVQKGKEVTMPRSSINTVRLACIAPIAAVCLTTATAGAVDIPDRFSNVDWRQPVDLPWDVIELHTQLERDPDWPFGNPYFMYDRVNMSSGGSSFLGAGIAFVNANDPGIDFGWVQVTTVYGIDTTPDEDLPLITGVDPANPQFWPASDETIYGRNGAPYSSYEAQTVNIFMLPDILDGHDMSWFDFSDPFTQVHLFRTYVPASEIYFPCPSDLNNDGVLDLNDVVSFVGAFTAGQFAADFNADGVYDLSDLVAFVGGFTNGCP